MRTKRKKRGNLVKRKVRLKQRRRKLFLTSIIFLAFAIIFTTLVYKLYINSKSKDLSYAINYSLTNVSEKDSRLLDVENLDLLFKDDDSAIVEASGYLKEKPHTETNVKGYFRKNTFGTWKLNNTSQIALKN